MFLYKLECQIAEHGLTTVILAANDDHSALELAEQLVKRQFLTSVAIEETALLEKKPVKSGAGYFLDRN
ncbi:DUF3906 family protein [Fodinisporobacter ferrooxydans]|uniref:DUF3906 family protein n=1 Tax=Fodinisporobacter ferrooxydans TaxID=2901836 RepID=A0ABY4CNR2_9BACL|nr:DUF3906 family protein [Alicyclobacillaceae bacterium MYW30-H2]